MTPGRPGCPRKQVSPLGPSTDRYCEKACANNTGASHPGPSRPLLMPRRFALGSALHDRPVIRVHDRPAIRVHDLPVIRAPRGRWRASFPRPCEPAREQARAPAGCPGGWSESERGGGPCGALCAARPAGKGGAGGGQAAGRVSPASRAVTRSGFMAREACEAGGRQRCRAGPGADSDVTQRRQGRTVAMAVGRA